MVRWIPATLTAALVVFTATAEARAQRYFTTDFSLNQVDVGRLTQRLGRVGIHIPFTLDGLVTTNITIGVPWTTLGTGRNYRLDGTLTSDRLVVSGVELREVDATLVYRDGVMQLRRLRFRVPVDGEPGDAIVGLFTGNASLELVPLGDAEFNLTLDGIPLRPLAGQFADLPEIAAGRMSGRLTGTVPANQMGEIGAWSARGEATIVELETLGARLDSASARFTLDESLLMMSDLAGRVGEGVSFTGAGTLRLETPYEQTAELAIDVRDAGALRPFAPELPWPEDVEGTIRLTARASGPLEPMEIEASGRLVAENLRAGPLAITSLAANYASDGETLRISDIVASLYEGELTGTASAPLAAEGLIETDVRWRGVDLAPLVAGLEFVPIDAGELDGGECAGTLTAAIPVEHWNDPSRWRMSAAAAVTGAEVGDLPLQNARIEARIEDGRLLVPTLDARAGEMRLAGSGRVALAGEYGYAADLQVERLMPGEAARLPERLRPPVRIGGRVNLLAEVQGTLQPPAITARGTASVVRLALEGLAADSASLLWSTDGESLRVRDLDVQLYRGALTGEARVPLSPETDGTLSLRWRDIDMTRLAEGARGRLPEGLAPEGLAGRVDGRLDLEIPRGRQREFEQWQGTARVTLSEGRAWGWTIERFTAAAELRERALRVSELDGRLGETSFEGSGRLQLAAPYEYTAEFRLNDGDLEKLNGLPAEWRLPFAASGRFSLSADVNGTIEPLRVRGQGSVAARDVSLARLDVPVLDLDWIAEGERLEVTRFAAQIAGGEARGEATLPLAADAAGRASLRWEAVELAQIASLLDDVPVQVAGSVAGELDATISAADAGGERAVTARSAITSPELALGPLEIANLDGTVELAENIVEYRFDGATLDGTLEAEGTLAVWELSERSDESVRVPPALPVPDALATTKEALAEPVAHSDSGTSEPVDRGTLRLRGISLSALAAAAEMNVEAIGGTLDATLEYQHAAADGLPAGRGTFDLTALRWGDRVVSERVRGTLTWRGTRVFLNGLTGRVAGGELRSSANLDLEDPSRSTLQIALRGARSADLEAFLPDVPLPVSGNLDLAFRVGLGARWRAIGRVALPQGRLDGVRLGSLQVPLSIIHDPRTGSTIIEMRESAAQLARGRITGTARAVQERTLALQGDLRFSGLDLQTVLQQLGTSSRFGRGQISGRVTLEGRNVTSSADLNGRIEATLRNVEPRSVPVVSALVPYLSGGVSAYSRIDSGELRARISSGNLLIQRFTLEGRALQLFAEGTISRTGRLSLDVVANTNVLGTNRFAAQALLDRLPPIGPPPVVLLVQANRFLSNRVVYLRVSGTIRRPVVRIRPAPQMREQMIRFFLSQSAAG